MKILYFAKHDSGGNDDEGAIFHALTELGHKVDRLHERKASPTLARIARSYDLFLFHHWSDPALLSGIETFKAFWYFDLVDYVDESLLQRNQRRIYHLKETASRVNIGFCTDGDWVNSYGNNLVRLTQGFDVRYVGKGKPKNSIRFPILFVGSHHGGGDKRISFVNFMNTKYSSSFYQVQRGTHQRALADLIASSDIVVAPDHPATNHYWSNRVYNTLGFGGFLLHPYCSTLSETYEDGKEIVYYRDRDDLVDKIEYYRSHPEEREEIAQCGLERTIAEHTYTHRCRELIQVVKNRLDST